MRLLLSSFACSSFIHAKTDLVSAYPPVLRRLCGGKAGWQSRASTAPTSFACIAFSGLVQWLVRLCFQNNLVTLALRFPSAAASHTAVMATRKAVARAAIDSIKPLHVRSTSVLGGRPAWAVGGGAAPPPSTRGGGAHYHHHHRRGNNRMSRAGGAESRILSGGRVRDNLVGPSRASLVQGGRHCPSPLSLVQGGGSARANNNNSSSSSRRPSAPSLVLGVSSPPPKKNLVKGKASSAAKLNGVPVQHQTPQHETYQQSRAALVRGRRSTLGGVVTLANGQRVNGARPAYLLRREAQQHQSQSQQQNAHSRYNASHSSGMSDNGSGAVVTDLSADETSSGSGGDGSGPGKQFESDLVVVLDMDECLIHSQFLSQQAKSFSAPELDNSSGDDGDGAVQQEDKYRQSDLRPTKSSAFHTDGEEAESIIAANCEYFRIHLPDGDLVHVNKRPKLDAFLADVTARFETHIFTAALDVYANPLLDRLEVDLGTKFAGRFYREHCILDPDLGVYVKDLGLILDKDQESGSDWSSAYDGEEKTPELDNSSGDDGDGAVQQEDKYRQSDLRPTKSSAFHTDGEEAESIIAANCEYFRIHLPDGDLVHVNKRPKLDAFLADVTARFETHIFTAALDVYANPLLDRLEVDLGTKFAGRFYREHCILDPDLGVYVKDLGLILDKDQESGSDWSSAYDGEEKKECDDDFVSSDLSSSFNEGRVVLVDNNPLSFLANPSNGILVSNFVSNTCECLDLLHVLAWL